MTRAKGFFITFEGVEGCGKSTQVRRLQERLVRLGRDVVVTREPGGTPVAEAIRSILLDCAHAGMRPMTELLLYAAARAQHVAEVIAPALDAGKTVLCDRFADSTTAYQGAGRGVEPETVAVAHRLATGGVWPDITIVLDVPVELGLARANASCGPDRIEQESIEFHRRVREGFLALARQDPRRVLVIDGTGSEDEVADEVASAIASRLVS
ncbi:MAG: dTMP kinase [Candidatus Hydrogenedentes bacterium]|nr:dTMP kinase [Candidatus Hydrogenedentota bacterium]